MKRIFWTALCLALVLSLTACGRTASVGSGDASAPDGGTKSAPAHDGAETSQPLDVENNGGYFVRVGGKVYFRQYGPDALPQTAVFGNFTDVWNAIGMESQIMSYDLVTGNVEAVFPDTGYGKLYYADGAFYLQERISGESAVMRTALDGAWSQTFCAGTLLGVSDAGLLAVCEDMQGGSYDYQLFRDGEQVADFLSASYMTFAGISDDGAFFVQESYDAETDESASTVRSLWQLPIGAQGSMTRLGTFPETEFMYSAEPEDFLVSGDKIGFVMGYYAGTGHFLQECVAVTAISGAQDSMEFLELNAGDGEEEGPGEAPKLTLSESGDIVTAPNVYGDLELRWNDDGSADLQLYDGFQWETLKSGFCPPVPDGSGYEKIAQYLEYLDGAAYVALADAYASPLDAIGWRDAYTLLGMEYLMIPASEGAERELASDDFGAILQGNVWFEENQPYLLWQQVSSNPDAFEPEANYAYSLPIASGAEWEQRERILSEAVYASASGEPDYSGYPLPEVDGEFLYLRVNRHGEVVFLTPVAPDALLSVEIGVAESELGAAVEKLNLSRRPSDEDTPWMWARLTSLQDGVTVRLERTPESPSDIGERVLSEGTFLPGETLLERALNRGERVAVRVSLPWRPEIRVSASKGGAYGAYVFGEDNYLHNEPSEGNPVELTLSGHPADDTDALSGAWLYRDPQTGEISAALTLQDGPEAIIETQDDAYSFAWSADKLYAETWEAPDLVCLSASDPNTVAALQGMEGEAGDYRFEVFRTDRETILHLTQANNGDGALSFLLDPDKFEFTFLRYEGTATPAAPLRNTILTAKVVKADRARGLIWIQAAGVIDELEDGTPIYGVKRSAPCVACALDSPELFASFEASADTEYPMEIFDVTFDGAGNVASLEKLAGR